MVTYLLQHARTLGDLSANILVKQSLDENLDSPMLALNAEFLGLDVDVDGVDVINGALLGGLSHDPVAELIVDGITAFLILVVANVELLLELAWKLSLAGFDSLLADINSPIIILDLSFGVEFRGLSLHLLKLVIAAGVTVLIVAVGAVLRAIFAAAVAILFSGAVLLSFAGSLSFSLILLALLGLVLEDKTTQLEAKVHVGTLTTSLAIEDNVAILDNVLSLRVLALLAENEFVDKAVKMVLKLGGIVSTIDDPTIILGVHVGLSSKLKTEVLDDMGARTGKRLGDARQVDDNGLDSVTLAFNLGLETLHLVAIEGVADIAADVDESHDDGIGDK